jgi:hypothetical protein
MARTRRIRHENNMENRFSSGRERGTFASRLVQFAITRVAVPRRANGPDPEPPLGVHEHESSGDRREHPPLVVR